MNNLSTGQTRPMYCTHCGENLPGEAKFCRACGSPVAGAEPPTQQAGEQLGHEGPHYRRTDSTDKCEAIPPATEWGSELKQRWATDPKFRAAVAAASQQARTIANEMTETFKRIASKNPTFARDQLLRRTLDSRYEHTQGRGSIPPEIRQKILGESKGSLVHLVIGTFITEKYLTGDLSEWRAPAVPDILPQDLLMELYQAESMLQTGAIETIREVISQLAPDEARYTATSWTRDFEKRMGFRWFCITRDENPEEIKKYEHIKSAPVFGPLRCFVIFPGKTFTCTLSQGHSGPHVAHTLFGKVVAVWDE